MFHSSLAVSQQVQYFNVLLLVCTHMGVDVTHLPIQESEIPATTLTFAPYKPLKMSERELDVCWSTAVPAVNGP